MRVLAIGTNGVKDMAAELYPEAEIYIAKLGPAKNETGYDALLSHMALQSVPIKKVKDVLKSYVNALKQRGEIVLIVPSLEWAAMQILSAKPDPMYVYHLFGTQDKPEGYHKSGFTLMELRALCSGTGIAVTHASTGEYQIGESLCECHSLRGIKK